MPVQPMPDWRPSLAGPPDVGPPGAWPPPFDLGILEPIILAAVQLLRDKEAADPAEAVKMAIERSAAPSGPDWRPDVVPVGPRRGAGVRSGGPSRLPPQLAPLTPMGGPMPAGPPGRIPTMQQIRPLGPADMGADYMPQSPPLDPAMLRRLMQGGL
jgi:hypothetical protein